MESKLRQLVLKLEVVDMLQLAHPYIKGIDKIHYTLNDKEISEVKNGGSLHHRSFGVGEDSTTDESSNGTSTSTSSTHIQYMKAKMGWTDTEIDALIPFYTTGFYIGFVVAPFLRNGKGDRSGGDQGRPKLNLVWPTQDFLKMVKSWDGFDESTMSIELRNLKGSMLPADLMGKDKKLKRSQTKVSTPRHHNEQDDN